MVGKSGRFQIDAPHGMCGDRRQTPSACVSVDIRNGHFLSTNLVRHYTVMLCSLVQNQLGKGLQINEYFNSSDV